MRLPMPTLAPGVSRETHGRSPGVSPGIHRAIPPSGLVRKQQLHNMQCTTAGAPLPVGRAVTNHVAREAHGPSPVPWRGWLAGGCGARETDRQEGRHVHQCRAVHSPRWSSRVFEEIRPFGCWRQTVGQHARQHPRQHPRCASRQIASRRNVPSPTPPSRCPQHDGRGPKEEGSSQGTTTRAVHLVPRFGRGHASST